MSQYFLKPYEPFGGDINVKVHLSNYATKSDIKNISHVDTSSFELKTNLATLKTEVDNLDIDKLLPVAVDLSKLSDAVKNNAVKKDVYDKLVAKVNRIDTSGFVLKSKYDADKSELENKIPDTSGFVKKTDYDSKISEIEGKIPVTNLATKTALTTVENKIPDVSNLVKKTDYNTKVTEIENKLNNHNHDKYITTPEFNTLAADVFNARLSQANLVTKTDFDAKLSSLHRKITSNKTKHVLVENEFKKLKTFDSSYFIGKNYLEEGGAQNYLAFQPISRYFKVKGKYILSWKSKGLSDATVTPYATSDNSLTPLIDHYGTRIRLKFSSCLKQPNKLTYDYGHKLNVYIVYELGASSSNDSDPTLKKCLFGAVTLTKNADIEKYGYSGFGIGFDRRSSFSFPGGGFG